MVMGGHVVNPGDAPFAVALRANVDVQAFSSGVIVRPDWVMTASHSVHDGGQLRPIEWYCVWTGTKGPSGKRVIDGRPYQIKRVVTAPKWDVALLQLTQNVELPGLPIALDPTRIVLDTDAWIAGWGYRTTVMRNLPLNLRYIAVRTSYACSDDDYLCTPGVFTGKLERPGGGALPGDSGGPLYVYDGAKPPALIGIVSGLDTVEKRAKPTPDARLSTRISAVYSWARQYIG
jgi:hypothetical protein